jgi:hypothetical protein
MASGAERRERQQVRVALYKGQPVPGEDHEVVCEVLERVRLNRSFALVSAISLCLGLSLLLLGHGALRWVAILWVFTSGLMTWTLLRQYKRISDGASKLGFRLRRTGDG